MIYCTKCGQQNADDARSCFNCGQPFSGQGSSTPFTSPPPTQQPPGSPWGSQPGGSPMQPRSGGGLSSVGEKKEPGMVIVYAFLTCGIYLYFWIHQTSTDIKNALGGREDINPQMDVILTLVTCGLYFIYLLYRYPQLILELQDRSRQPRNDISTISIILGVVGLGIVSIFMIQTELNKVWDSATRG